MIKYSPYYITILCVFGSLIQYVFNRVPFIELVDYLPIVVVLFSLLLLKLSLNKGIRKMPLFFWAWILYVVLHIFYSIIMTGSVKIPLIGAYTYMVAILFWYEYMSIYKDKFSSENFFKFTMVIAAIAAIFGIYQYFCDMSLFGYASSINKIYSLDQYLLYSEIRVTSIFTSIQVFSCFIVLALVLLLDNYKSLNRTCRIGTGSLIALSALLTGSKIVLLSIFVFFYYNFFIKNHSYNVKRKAILIPVFLCAGLIGCTLLIGVQQNVSNQASASPFMRIIKPIQDFDTFIKEETFYEGSRINVYKRALTENDHMIFGHGLGSSNSIAVEKRAALESYLLGVFAETGIVGVIIFIGCLYSAFRKPNGDICHKGTLVVMVVLMMLNQSFDSVVFFPFYCFVITPLVMNTRRVNSRVANALTGDIACRAD